MDKSISAYCTIMGSKKLSTTVLACASASGEILPPLIIFKAGKLCSSWRGTNDLSETMYSSSESGFITTVIFYNYFEKFCQVVLQRPLLLILDGHITHLSPQTVDFAIAQNVTIIKFPAHTIDLLQPLDRIVFKPLKID